VNTLTVAPAARWQRDPRVGRSPASCLYEGSIRHRRSSPAHRLHSSLFMAYLDLAELPELFDGHLLWSARRPALAWFRRDDYLGDPEIPLGDAVRDLVEQRTGKRPTGPVRLLTHLRYLGWAFNPVSFYYCFDDTGERVSAVVAEVTNTPWGERHAYVLPASETEDHGTVRVLRGTFHKRLHVSPFMGMDHSYRWSLTEPGDQLLVHIESLREGKVTFDATLTMRRRVLDSPGLRRALWRYPLMTMRVSAGIYGHALRLKLKGARYFPRPRRSAALGAESRGRS